MSLLSASGGAVAGVGALALELGAARYADRLRSPDQRPLPAVRIFGALLAVRFSNSSCCRLSYSALVASGRQTRRIFALFELKQGEHHNGLSDARGVGGPVV
jgi:hypothetical protein